MFSNVEQCIFLSKCQTSRSGSMWKRSETRHLRVALAIAPMRTGGMAMMIQPRAATYDSIWALPAVLLDNTLWKYTCKNRHSCIGALEYRCNLQTVIAFTWIHLLIVANLSDLRFSWDYSLLGCGSGFHESTLCWDVVQSFMRVLSSGMWFMVSWEYSLLGCGSYSLTGNNRRFRKKVPPRTSWLNSKPRNQAIYCLIPAGYLSGVLSNPEDMGISFLRNVSKLISDYMISLTKKIILLR
jgi:hypothetical protein